MAAKYAMFPMSSVDTPAQVLRARGDTGGLPTDMDAYRKQQEATHLANQEKLKYLATQGVFPDGMGKANGGAAGPAPLLAWGDRDKDAGTRLKTLQGDTLAQGLEDKRRATIDLPPDQVALYEGKGKSVELPGTDRLPFGDADTLVGTISTAADNATAMMNSVTDRNRRAAIARGIMQSGSWTEWEDVAANGLSDLFWGGTSGGMKKAKTRAEDKIKAVVESVKKAAMDTGPSTPQGGAAPGHPVMG
jgi:hypothetical protein